MIHKNRAHDKMLTGMQKEAKRNLWIPEPSFLNGSDRRVLIIGEAHLGGF